MTRRVAAAQIQVHFAHLVRPLISAGVVTFFLLLQAQPSAVPSSLNPGNTSFAAAFTSNCQVVAGAGALL